MQPTPIHEAADKSARSARGAEDLRSPIAWLVLALVIEQPSHGYEISQRYEQRFGAFAAMSAPRIYAALDRLRDAEMIEQLELQPVEPVRKQHLMRRSYRATAAGVHAYRSWVAQRMQDDPQQPQLLGRIATVGVLGLDAVLDVVDRYEQSCLEELRRLPTDSDRLATGTADIHEITQALVVDQQRRELGARIEWATHARGILQLASARAKSEHAEPT